MYHVSFWVENEVQMLQNGYLLTLTTTATQLENIEKSSSLIIQSLVHDGNTSIRKVE